MKLVRPGIVVTGLALAIAVPLGAGAAASNSGVHPTTGTIAGVVTDVQNDPLPGVCVTAQPTNQSTPTPDTVQAVTDGSYLLSDVPAGTYTMTFGVCVGSMTEPNVQSQYYDNTQALSQALPVSVVGGATTNLDTQKMKVGGGFFIRLTLPAGVPIDAVRPVVVPIPGQTGGPDPTGIQYPFSEGAWSQSRMLPGRYDIYYRYCDGTTCRPGYIGAYMEIGTGATPTSFEVSAGTIEGLYDTVVIPPAFVSTTTVTASPSSAVPGASASVLAHVTDSDATVTPTGSVSFYEGSTLLHAAVLDASGNATFIDSALTAGSHTIRVDYAGDINSSASSGTATIPVTAPGSGGTGAGGTGAGGTGSGGTGSGGTGTGGTGSSATGSSGSGGAAVPVVTAAPVTRLAGTDRIATAVTVSQNSFPTGNAGAVVLARADDYPDALVGGPLAAAKNAPLLLTEGSTLPAATATEVKRVLPAGGTVYVLGGTSAIPTSVTSQLTSIGYTITRYSGADRYATAVAVATALGSPTTVLLATGTNFPDALAAGPAAAHVHAAILLTDGSTVPAETATYLAGAHLAYAIGGPAAAAVPSATAILGSDRYATAAAVATKFFPSSAVVGVATGTGFPDALAGGAQLALMGGPLLLSSVASVPTATVNYLTADHTTLTNAYVYGGTAVLGSTVLIQLTAAFGS
jgi:hypothetical protein